MRAPYRKLVMLACFLIVGATNPLAAQGGLTVSVAESKVTMMGYNLVAGDQVALVFAIWPNQSFIPRLTTGSTMVDVTGRGRAFFTPDWGPIPTRSMWLAVNMRTGQFGVGAPEGFDVRFAELPSEAYRSNKESLVDGVVGGGTHLEVLVVRPLGGAWVGRIIDGSALDDDGVANRSIETSFRNLRPKRESGPPPEALQPGDHFFVIDPINVTVLHGAV